MGPVWAASVRGQASTYRGQGHQICVRRPRRPFTAEFKAEFLGLKQTALSFEDGISTETIITLAVLKFEYS